MASVALVQELLRAPDQVKAVLEVTQVVTSSTNQESPDARRDSQNRRVLAVISHKDDWDLTEEGCLFICKYKTAPAGRVQAEELEIQRVFPIYGDFATAMSQMRRGFVDMRSMSTTKSMLDQPRAVITLNITPAEGLQKDAHAQGFFTHDVQGLKHLVAECRRLKEVSDVDAHTVVNLAQSTTHFSWLRPYFGKSSTIGAPDITTQVTSMPQDLRQINQPLLERLSPACAGLIADEHADVQIIRDEWIRIKAQEMSRKGRRTLKLRLGTFNVNGKMPTQDLSSWIQGTVNIKPPLEEVVVPTLPPVKNLSPMSVNPFDWITRRSRSSPQVEVQVKEEPLIRVDLVDPNDPDILVLGFQELDLSTEALLYSTSTVREDAWCHAVFAALGEKAVRYEKLASKQLVGMLILVIVKQSLKGCFGEVQTSAAGAGILGVMGNKGGAAIRLSFRPPWPADDIEKEKSIRLPGSTTFTFVNAHLAAFDEMFEKRNSDFQDLSKRLGFENHTSQSIMSPISSDPGHGGDSDAVQTSPDFSTNGAGQNPPLSIYETDMLFWMGDLNYRVDLPDTDLRRTLRDDGWDNESKFQAILRFDQLKNAMKSNKAFVGFQESTITHMPTYRFSPGLMMDKLGYDIKRKPAWTDRILYMRGPGCIVNQQSYTGHPQVTMSDHRPVGADFAVEIDLYDTEERQANMHNLFEEVSQLDSEGASNRRQLKINDTFVEFDKLCYGKPVEKTIVIRNTGKTPCAFRFVPVQLDSPILPEWLQVQPMAGVLLPDEATEIVLRAEVDDTTASILNVRPKDLSGTLILHTVLGKDHFISVSGEYQYTCFANKLSRLTRLRGPIRMMDSPNDLLPENNSINAPREIMRLVNWMMTSTASVDGMFITSGDDSVVNTIRECLDNGNDFPYPPDNSDPKISLAFATTLLRFLGSLPDSLIPASLHSRCLEMTNRDEAFELLDELPPVSVNVWISLTAFLHFICQSSKDSDQTEKLASVVAPIVLRDDLNSASLPMSPKGKSNFLLYFIT